MKMKRIFLLLVLSSCLLPVQFISANSEQIDRQCGFGCDHSFANKGSSWQQVTGWLSSLFPGEKINRSYAVVVGINKFVNYDPLPTEQDPIRIKNYLMNEAGFDRVHVLTGLNVTRERLGSIMHDMRKHVKTNDRFLLYWQGHGETLQGDSGNVGYLPLTKSKMRQPHTMIPMRQLEEWNSWIPARHSLYLLDACFSGLAGVAVQGNELTDETLKQLSKKGRHIISAGKANEQTFAHEGLGGSVFTTAVLDGLRGSADAENGFSKDGVVSIAELSFYIRKRINEERIRYKWHKPITPQVTRLPSKEDGSFFFFTKEYQSLSQQGGQIIKDESGVTVQGMSGGSDIRLAHNMVLKSIPAGRFQMGSNIGTTDEKPVHTVTIPKPFYISSTEVTFSQYDAYADLARKPKPKDQGWGRKNRPVINVSWNDAQEYAGWLSDTNEYGLQCRLPSEAEWEYVARGGSSSKYFWGDLVGKNNANCDGCGSQWDKKSTAPVGSFSANRFGVYDMSGNTWEWTQDAWHDSYHGAPSNGRARMNSSNSGVYVLRGGSWWNPPYQARSAHRSSYPSILTPTGPSDLVGFRIACF